VVGLTVPEACQPDNVYQEIQQLRQIIIRKRYFKSFERDTSSSARELLPPLPMLCVNDEALEALTSRARMSGVYKEAQKLAAQWFGARMLSQPTRRALICYATPHHLTRTTMPE
jgi:hypothetical protein